MNTDKIKQIYTRFFNFLEAAEERIKETNYEYKCETRDKSEDNFDIDTSCLE